MSRTAIALICGTALLVAGSAQAIHFKAKAKSWYLQVVAVTDSGHYDDRSGVIGRIPGAKFGKDLHDIPAFSSVNGAPIAVVSVRGSEWGDDAGEYLSDYRPPGIGRNKWDFVVTSNDPNARVTLMWDGLHIIEENPNGGFDTYLANDNKVLRHLQLIDLAKGKVVRRGVSWKGKVQQYTFRMDGENERHFRWVLGVPRKSELSNADVVTLESVSPMPVSFDARLSAAGEGYGKTKQRGFAAPPALGVMPGEGVRQPSQSRLDGQGANMPGTDLGPSNGSSSLFQPLEELKAEAEDETR